MNNIAEPEQGNVAYQVMWNRLISVVEEQAQAHVLFEIAGQHHGVNVVPTVVAEGITQYGFSHDVCDLAAGHAGL